MRLQVLGVVVAVLTLAARPARADVHITIADGHVTVSATDATVRQILAEWARVGQTRIVNAERVAGNPISIELTDVPEAQALDTILRSVSGYLAAPRAVPMANASAYDRIYLLPTSAGTPARVSSPAQPAFATPGPVFPPPPDDQADEDGPRVQGAQSAPNQPNGPRGPAFTTFPPPPQFQPRQGPQPQQMPNAPAPPAPSSAPTAFGAPATTGAPVGVAVPGMVVPVPQQDPAAGDRR